MKLPKMTFLDRLISPKFDFTQNRSGSKIIKFQQSQALTSYFDSFWKIVHILKTLIYTLHKLLEYQMDWQLAIIYSSF